MKQSERSFQFTKNYICMRDGGKSVYEIADFYHLSYSYAYKLVRKLAEQMGIPYEFLLVCPHSTHIVTREIALFDETIEASLDDAGHDELFSQLRDQEEAEDFLPRDSGLSQELSELWQTRMLR